MINWAEPISWHDWVELPPVMGLLTWACIRGRYQYVLSFDPRWNNWAVSAKLDREDDPARERIDLGWQYKTRAEAEAAFQQHVRGALS